MEDVIKLPAKEDKPAATKRSRAAAVEPGGEERKRQKNVSLVSVLGEEDSSVKMLEELVFGAEDELLGRLVSSPHTGCFTGTDQSNRTPRLKGSRRTTSHVPALQDQVRGQAGGFIITSCV